MNITVDKTLFNITAQAAHFGVAAAIMEGTRIRFPKAALPVLFVGLTLAAIKEFWYDYHYETADERGLSLLDFSMYAAGLAIGFVVG